jgi:UDP-glucuronate 4-epimerase
VLRKSFVQSEQNLLPLNDPSPSVILHKKRLSLRVADRDKIEQRIFPKRKVESVLVTGAAGFIGSWVAKTLLKRADSPKVVVGIDNFNAYYDVKLKEYRSNIIRKSGVIMVRGDVCNATLLESLFEKYHFSHVVHLAAQAGVRYSMTHPKAYVTANVMCTTNLLEIIRKRPHPLPIYVYASSSSVYGHSPLQPFSEIHHLDQPSSLYAATKKSCEDIAYVYHHLYGIRATGLRFFTVYGPWGRPDMALWQWVDAAMKKTPIRLYEKDGKVLKRDFTYIDDIVDGVIRSVYYAAPFEIFNLGKGNPDKVVDLIQYVEASIGTKVDINRVPIPKADVFVTFANVSHAAKVLGYKPKTQLKSGVKKFAEWYKSYVNHQGF